MSDRCDNVYVVRKSCERVSQSESREWPRRTEWTTETRSSVRSRESQVKKEIEMEDRQGRSKQKEDEEVNQDPL